jgi:hypothetical protein
MATFAQLGSIATSGEFQARVAYAMAVAATNVYSEALPTNAVTAAANAILHFAAVPGTIVAGMPINNITTPAVIPAGTTVLSVTATTVTMSANAVSPGVAIGDSIVFANGHTKRATYATQVVNGNYNLAQAALAVLGNAAIAVEATAGVNGNTIPDTDIQFSVNSLWNVLAGA